MREHCGAVLAGADAVVPVPLHRRREWTRGFNQADAIAGGLGLPVWRLLRRTRHTDPQSTLAAPERRRNVHGAFAVRRGAVEQLAANALSGACLVLVDDVSTTGATLDACAEVLKAGGRAGSAGRDGRARASLGITAPPAPRSARREQEPLSRLSRRYFNESRAATTSRMAAANSSLPRSPSRRAHPVRSAWRR